MKTEATTHPYLNEFHRKWMESCMRANEYMKKHPLSPEQLRANALRLRAQAEKNALKRRAQAERKLGQ